MSNQVDMWMQMINNNSMKVCNLDIDFVFTSVCTNEGEER